MTDEELQAQLEAIEAELGRRKWAKVDDLMPRVEALTDEELAEFSNRVSALKSARDRKVQEMTKGVTVSNQRVVKPWNPAEFAADLGDAPNRKPKKKYSEMTREELNAVDISALSRDEMNQVNGCLVALHLQGK